MIFLKTNLKMKSRLGFLAFTLLAFALAFGLSCSHSTKPAADDNKGRVYLMTGKSGLSDYMKLTLDELHMNVVSDATNVPDVVIVAGKDVATLSDSDVKLMILACLNGETIVVDAPSKDNFVSLKTKIETFLNKEENSHLKALSELGSHSLYNVVESLSYDDGGIPEGVGKQKAYEAIAVRKSQIYFVHDINEETIAGTDDDYDDPAELPELPEQDPAADEKVNVPSNAPAASVQNDHSVITKHSVEAFAEWLEKEGVVLFDPMTKDEVIGILISKGVSSVDDAMQAQSQIHNFTLTYSASGKEHYDGRYDGRKENIQGFVDTWTACDINNSTDYYLVKTSVVCNNQQLGYKNDWDNGKYAGPYFHKCKINVAIDGAQLRTADCKPTTSTGSSTFSISSGFNIGANVGFNASGPTGGISSGYSFSKSSSRSIPDISVTNNCSGNTAEWFFTAPDVNPYWGGFLDAYTKCDGAKAIQTNQAVFDSFALFTRPSNPDSNEKTVRLNVTIGATVRSMTGWVTGAIHLHWNEYGTYNGFIYHNSIDKPSNACRDYIMAFDAPAGTSPETAALLSNVLKEYISDWNSNQKYYAVGVNRLDDAAKSNFAIAKKRIEANKDVLHTRGFSGKYTFFVKRSEEQGKVAQFDLQF